MVLDDLKAAIERIEGRTKTFTATPQGGAGQARILARTLAPTLVPAWTFGLDILDAALPLQDGGTADNGSTSNGRTGNGEFSRGALPLGACHDFTPLVKTDVPQVAGFVAALLQRLPRLRHGPVVWCQTAHNAREYGRIYAPGLLGSALSPERILFVHVPREREFALVLEECVRVPRLAAVVGEGPAPGFTASRRLTLAAQQSHVPCLIINTGGTIGASAAATRWRIAPIAGPPDPNDPDGPGAPAWSITLARARGSNAALNPTLASPVNAAWNHETHTFHLVSPFRPAALLEGEAPHGARQRSAP